MRRAALAHEVFGMHFNKVRRLLVLEQAQVMLRLGAHARAGRQRES